MSSIIHCGNPVMKLTTFARKVYEPDTALPIVIVNSYSTCVNYLCVVDELSRQCISQFETFYYHGYNYLNQGLTLVEFASPILIFALVAFLRPRFPPV